MKSFTNNPLFIRGNRFSLTYKERRQIVSTIRRGGVVMYPTDTCYALSANIYSEDGVATIYRIKQRPLDKQVSVAFADKAMLNRYCRTSSEADRFVQTYLPERCTLLLHKKEDAWTGAKILVDTDIVGARMPKDLFTRKLIQASGMPLVTTSANISGYPELYTVTDVYRFLRQCTTTPDIIILGHLIPNPPSTIIDMTEPVWKTVRQGSFVL